MTTHAHILDALRTMEERGVEPTWEDFEAMAELLNDEENEIITNRISAGATGSR